MTETKLSLMQLTLLSASRSLYASGRSFEAIFHTPEVLTLCHLFVERLL